MGVIDTIFFLDDPADAVCTLLNDSSPESCAVVTDTNVSRLIDDVFGAGSAIASIPRVIIPAGEDNKNMHTLSSVWDGFEKCGLTRRSVVLNIGGGMVTDMGGFAASTFKRGVPFINIPTTLLGAADASVGGKTGINFGGYKNEIGAFAMPVATFISPRFFGTLTDAEFYSGYAEIVKMGFIAGHDKVLQLLSPDGRREVMGIIPDALRFAVEEKARIVETDPMEKGVRRVLNLGHTAGHAFESYFNSRGYYIPHGEAVANGLLLMLILSHLELGSDSRIIYTYSGWLHRNFKRLPVGCKDYDELIRLMLNDKKNSNHREVSFVLIDPSGKMVVSYPLTADKIRQSLDLFRDL